MTDTPPPTPVWQPIATAPCDDRYAFVRWASGAEEITDLDHDSDPDWWAERGATHWRDMTDEEKEIHWGKQARRAHDRDVQDEIG